jgi:hypothetical protein
MGQVSQGNDNSNRLILIPFFQDVMVLLAEQCHSQINPLNKYPKRCIQKMVDNLQAVTSWLSRFENMSLFFEGTLKYRVGINPHSL